MERKSNCDEHEQWIWLEALLNKFLNDKLVAKIIDIEMKPAIPEGDNYSSIIYRTKLTMILRNGQKSKMSVILKKAHEHKDKLEALSEIPVFKVETKVYTDVLQKFETLMNEYQDNNDKLWCNLIGYRPYDLVVLEDLKLKNYGVADRKKMLDLNHSKLVLHSLGRLHALGYVLMQKGLLDKGDLTPFYLEMESVMIERLYKCGLIVLSRTIEKYWTAEWFKGITSNLTKCHGRKHASLHVAEEDLEKRFLDFQTTHINPYIFDILHFLYVSVHPDLRRSNYDQLISIYHKSLQSTLAVYGFEERTPTLDHIHSEAKRTEYYSFICNVILLPISIAEVKGALKLEYLNDESKCMEAFNEDIFKTDLYKSAVQPELKKWFNNGLF